MNQQLWLGSAFSAISAVMFLSVAAELARENAFAIRAEFAQIIGR